MGYRDCDVRYSPLPCTLHIDPCALRIEKYSQKEENFKNEVVEAVIDNKYGRLIDGRSIDISHGGVHNIVVGNDIDKTCEERVPVDGSKAVVADGPKAKQVHGSKRELRSVVGIAPEGRVQPLGCFPNTRWDEIETKVKDRLATADESAEIPFVYDGKPGSDPFLDGITEYSGQRL